jgi:glucosamine-6-phosphate deaminase
VKIYVLPNSDIAGYVADSLGRQLLEKPDSVLGMTTGTTPFTTGIYREWVSRVASHELDLSIVRFVNPDEFIGIPLNHPESYRTYMRKHLFDAANVPLEHTLCPNVEEQGLEAECARFDDVVQSWGGIDWQLLGLGQNGHICFIEPNEAIPASSYIVDIAEENRIAYTADFGTLNAVPLQAVTTGLRMVMSTRKIVLVAVGEKKADIVAKTVLSPVSTRIPATFLQLHADTTIILDQDSAKGLPESIIQQL